MSLDDYLGFPRSSLQRLGINKAAPRGPQRSVWWQDLTGSAACKALPVPSALYQLSSPVKILTQCFRAYLWYSGKCQYSFPAKDIPAFGDFPCSWAHSQSKFCLHLIGIGLELSNSFHWKPCMSLLRVGWILTLGNTVFLSNLKAIS